MYEVTMPKLSDSMEEGKIIEWKVKEGDKVREGDVLAEVESDKAAMELECFHDGVLSRIVHGDNDEVAVGEVIGYIAAEGEKEAPKTAPVPKKEKKPPAEEKKKPEEPKPKPEPKATPAPPKGGRVAISPYARKLAEQHGIDTTRLEGSGPGGRIVAADIEKAAKGEAAEKAAPAPAPTHRPSADEELPALEVAEDEAEVEDASFRLKTLARRVVASKHVIPHFYVTRGVDVTRLLARKDEAKEKFGASVTHLVMLACLKALAEHPEVNRSYDRGRIFKWKGIHLGLAVDTEEGLTVAVLRDAQGLALKDIVERTRPLVERARAGKLSADDRRHPTFTISNMGMFDVEHFAPIINPPSAVTLAVASALPAPIVVGDTLRIGILMRLTMSCDHRIIDGAVAARFLTTLRTLLEDPDRLLEGQ